MTYTSEGRIGHERAREAARLRRERREAAQRTPPVHYRPGHFTSGLAAWWPNPAHRPDGTSLGKSTAAQVAGANAARAEGKGFGDGTFRGMSAASDERQTLRRLGGKR